MSSGPPIGPLTLTPAMAVAGHGPSHLCKPDSALHGSWKTGMMRPSPDCPPPLWPLLPLVSGSFTTIGLLKSLNLSLQIREGQVCLHPLRSCCHYFWIRSCLLRGLLAEGTLNRRSLLQGPRHHHTNPETGPLSDSKGVRGLFSEFCGLPFFLKNCTFYQV